MRPSRPITVTALVVALGAGVMIAGLPDDPPGRISTGNLVPSDFVPAGSIAAATTSTSTSTTTPTSTTAAATTSTSSTTSTTVVMDERSSIAIVVANATGVESVAGVFRDRIRPLGYTEVYATAAKQEIVGSTIYFLPGFEDEALRLAAEVGYAPDQVVGVATQTDAPAYWLNREFEVLVIIGKTA
ncbi:MAG: LytR C-terminal domain-containing protein [Ilumatobacteraceae bacterium]